VNHRISFVLVGASVEPDFDRVMRAAADEGRLPLSRMLADKRRNGDVVVNNNSTRACFRFRYDGAVGYCDLICSNRGSGEIIAPPDWAKMLGEEIEETAKKVAVGRKKYRSELVPRSKKLF